MLTDRSRVKLCKNPDQVCLQGGCGYCRDTGTFKTVGWLRAYAKRKGWLEDFNFGYSRQWPNQPKEVGDDD